MFMRHESIEDSTEAAIAAADQQWHAGHVCSVKFCGQSEITDKEATRLIAEEERGEW